jgi:hypothetical protein
MRARAHYVLTQLLVLLLSVSVAFPQQEMPMAPQPQQNAPMQGRPAFTQQELDQMLAPIALYPDSLLSQILMASTYPLEVVEAARWSKANPNTKGAEAVKAVEQNSWDPSVKSLVAFPQVLQMMDEKLTWMQRLGDAFLSQQAQVMDTISSRPTRSGWSSKGRPSWWSRRARKSSTSPTTIRWWSTGRGGGRRTRRSIGGHGPAISWAPDSERVLSGASGLRWGQGSFSAPSTGRIVTSTWSP